MLVARIIGGSGVQSVADNGSQGLDAVVRSDNMHPVNLSDVLAEARKRAGLSFRSLAAVSGTSASTLHAYEHGLKEPSVSVARRIIRAAGFDLDLKLAVEGQVRGLTSNEIFKLELDRMIAEHLIADPHRVLAIARQNLVRAKADRPIHEQPWIAQWESTIELPLLELVELLLADDAESLHLKQTSPFVGVLSQEERVLASERMRNRRRGLVRAS